jgi:hypothetical protein
MGSGRQTLLHEETSLPFWMIYNFTEHPKTQLFVERTYLETESVEPNPDTSLFAGKFLGTPHQRLPVTFALEVRRDVEQVDIQPVEERPAAQPSNRPFSSRLDPMDRKGLKQTVATCGPSGWTRSGPLRLLQCPLYRD